MAERMKGKEREKDSSGGEECDIESTMGYLELVPLSQSWLDFPRGQISFYWKFGG